jgi:hypothetical protein
LIRELAPGQHGQPVDELPPQVFEFSPVRAHSWGQLRRGLPVVGTQELQQQLGTQDLHRVRHDPHTQLGADLPEPVQGTELGRRPLPRDHLPAEAGPLGHGEVGTRLQYPPLVQVPGGPMEHPVLGRAVARLAASRQDRSVPGAPRDTRKTSTAQ